MCDNPNSNQQLQELIAIAAANPRHNVERQKALTQLVHEINHSGCIFRHNSPNYEEALQNTWLYVCRQPERYDPNRASVCQWINMLLNYRLLDEFRASRNEQPFLQEWIETIPAKPDTSTIFEKIRQWIEDDVDRVLRKTHMRGRPDVHCQNLLRVRIVLETSWNDVATEFEITQSRAPNFYCRNCLPLLRKWFDDQDFF